MTRSRLWALAGVLGVGATALGVYLGYLPGVKKSDETAAIAWAVDPRHGEPDVPPEGRSLFDYLVTEERLGKRIYNVPYPFEALLNRIEREVRADASGLPPVKRLLIPMGRSLQRAVAAPDFFKYPRAVVAVDGMPVVRNSVAGIWLKDKLYLGFQEKSSVVEVISYNEAAGRFEFQLVKDYRAGTTPKVVYAKRALCTSCHQNAAPIFARPLWDETNANDKVKKLLQAERRAYYGFPLTVGVDIAYAFDNATDHANRFQVLQRLWRDGCGPSGPGDECRAALFVVVLRHRLSGEDRLGSHDERFREAVAVPMESAFAKYWPNGLAISNPDVANRDPLEDDRDMDKEVPGGSAPPPLNRAALAERAEVSTVHEPLAPRAPLEIWHAPARDGELLPRLVAGLSQFLSPADVGWLRSRLPVDDISQAVGKMNTEARVGKHDAFSDKPFRRAVLMRELSAVLGLPAQPWCCVDTAGFMPAAVDEPPPALASSTTDALRVFERYCAACHRTPEASPPNFLFGTTEEVEVKLDRCAERLFFRLSMWELPEDRRPKTGMPPSPALAALSVPVHAWAEHADLALLKAEVAARLAKRTASPPKLSDLQKRGYSNLRSCLH
jgi:mono/diheme cytochrome c family protein